MTTILNQDDTDKMIELFESGIFTARMFTDLMASHNLLRNIAESYVLDVQRDIEEKDLGR